MLLSFPKADALSNVLSIPEEILERIISLVLQSCSFTTFVVDTQTSFSSNKNPTSLLLVCKIFERIAKPLVYTTLYLRTREQAAKLATTLTAQPQFGVYIRAVRVDGPSASGALSVAAQLLTDLHSGRPLEILDVKLVDDRTDWLSGKADLERLCAAIRHTPDVRRLIIRQSGYLSSNAMASFVHALATGVRKWTSLEQVDFRYKPTPLPLPISNGRDPLATALASSPHLRVVRARRPTLLNTFLLDVAKNPVLERIELLDGTDMPDAIPTVSSPTTMQIQKPYSACDGVAFKSSLDVSCAAWEAFQAAAAELSALPQSVFASQAVEHPRLHELVRAGRLHLILERSCEWRRWLDRVITEEQRTLPVSESSGGCGDYLDTCAGR